MRNHRFRTDGLRSIARRRQSAFTLIELLVVIGIIGVLVAILMPVLSRARQASQAVVCQSNQRQLMLAFLAFANDHEGHLPGNYFDSVSVQPDPSKQDWLLGADPNQGNVSLEFLDGPQKGTIYRYVNNMSTYLCPAYQIGAPAGSGAGSNGRFDYAAFLGFAGASVSKVNLQARFSDPNKPAGTYEELATPIICEEDPASGINQSHPEGGHTNVDEIGHYHNGGGFYASIDGSVHWFKEPLNAGASNWSSRAPSGVYKSIGPNYLINWGYWDHQ